MRPCLDCIHIVLKLRITSHFKVENTSLSSYGFWRPMCFLFHPHLSLQLLSLIPPNPFQFSVSWVTSPAMPNQQSPPATLTSRNTNPSPPNQSATFTTLKSPPPLLVSLPRASWAEAATAECTKLFSTAENSLPPSKPRNWSLPRRTTPLNAPAAATAPAPRKTRSRFSLKFRASAWWTSSASAPTQTATN